MVIASIPGCSREDHIGPQPDTNAPLIRITTPLPGEWVADTAHVAIDATDDIGVARVTLWVDGRPSASRHEEPWSFPWDTSALPDSSLHVLRAEAVDAAGNLGVSDSIGIRVRSNHAPEVRIVWPPDGLWIERGEITPPWRCVAIDPEDGILPPASVFWRCNGSPVCQEVLACDPPGLPAGRHRVTAIAEDRWGRHGSATCSLMVFVYSDATAPGSVVEDFLAALRARRPLTALDMLSPRFALHSPGRGALDPPLAFEAFGAALAALFADSSVASLQMGAHVGAIEVFQLREKHHAKVELRDVELRIERIEDEEPATAASILEIRSSAARIYLSRGSRLQGDDVWGIVTWWDLHGSTWTSPGGSSLSDLLNDALR